MVSGRRASWAAATSLLYGITEIRVGTVARWLILALIPIVPVMVELADWPKWVKVPFLPVTFHLIYWWAFLVLLVGAWEISQKGRRRVAWLVYWQERARTLAGNIDEIGQNLLGGKLGGGKPASPDRIAAGILQQITDVVTDLTRPDQGVHVMACMLVPIPDGMRNVIALQAVAYNQNAGRGKTRIERGTPSPAFEAFDSGVAKIVADTLEEPYRKEFEGRPYRCVMAFPVVIGGQKLAVVTVDATQEGHFTEAVRVQTELDAAIFPYLKLIGLARIAEQKGGRRGKNNFT